MRTYYWDFMGPRSEAIARHHATHLGEFLQQNQLEGCEAGVEVESPMRAVAWLKAPEPAQPIIEKALRPPRHSA
jgi:hypothetical protein